MTRRHIFPSLAHCLDQRGQRRRLLPPTWVVEEKAGERLAPRLQDARERSAFEVRRRAVLSKVGQANIVERGPNDQFNIVDDQRAGHGNAQRFLAVVEFPPINLVPAMAEVDAPVLQQIARRLGRGMGCEVRGRSDDRCAVIRRDTIPAYADTWRSTLCRSDELPQVCRSGVGPAAGDQLYGMDPISWTVGT
jgi:hypothetical protein